MLCKHVKHIILLLACCFWFYKHVGLFAIVCYMGHGLGSMLKGLCAIVVCYKVNESVSGLVG